MVHFIGVVSSVNVKDKVTSLPSLSCIKHRAVKMYEAVRYSFIIFQPWQFVEGCMLGTKKVLITSKDENKVNIKYY